MNSKFASLAVALTTSCVGLVTLAQETKPPATTNAVAAPRRAAPAGQSPAPAAPAVNPSVTEAPPAPILSTPPPTPSLTLAPAQVEPNSDIVAELPIIVAAPISPVAVVREDTRRRLEPPTPAQMIEKYGTIGFLVKQPEPRNLVELINPFAPAEFGGQRREIYNRNPNLKPGATLPRNFIRGDVPSEPDLSLFSWPW